MTKQIKNVTKKRGRPATGHGKNIGLRLDDEMLRKIEEWMKQFPEDKMSRHEAIRRLIDHALTGPTGLTRRQLENLNAGDAKAVDDD